MRVQWVSDAALEQLHEQGWKPPAVTWIGTLVGVVVRKDRRDVTVRVRHRPLGVVDGAGLVTAASRDALRQGLVDPPPASESDGRWRPLVAVLYDRWRSEYGTKAWRHKTPGARVFVASCCGACPPTAYLSAPRERRCNHLPGDFLCSST